MTQGGFVFSTDAPCHQGASLIGGTAVCPELIAAGSPTSTEAEHKDTVSAHVVPAPGNCISPLQVHQCLPGWHCLHCCPKGRSQHESVASRQLDKLWVFNQRAAAAHCHSWLLSNAYWIATSEMLGKTSRQFKSPADATSTAVALPTTMKRICAFDRRRKLHTSTKLHTGNP